MRVSSAFIGFVGAAAGLAAGIATYQSSAAVDETPERATIAVPAVGRPLPDPPPRIRTVDADCTPPAKLQDGVCITRVVQTVPVAAPQPASVAQPASAPASSDGGQVELTEEQREEAHEAAEEAAEEAEEAAEEAAEQRCERDDDDSDDCQDDSGGSSESEDD